MTPSPALLSIYGRNEITKDLVKVELQMRREEKLFSCSLGMSQDDSGDDASHGAFLLDRISLHKKVRGRERGG